MKVIFQEFGTATVSIITAMLLLAIVFGISFSGHHGILEIVGVVTQKESITYSSYEDFDSVVTWSQRAAPVVYYRAESGRFFAEENANFLIRYLVKDHEGSIFPMNQVILNGQFSNRMVGKIVDVRKVNGSSIMRGYFGSSGYINFPSPGVYEVYFQVRDKENVTSIWRIPIAVDEGRNSS